MSDPVDEMVKQRVDQKMRRIRRLVAHGILTAIIFYGVIFAGAAGMITALPAVIMVLLAIFALMAHGLWLGLPMIQESLTRQEMQRQQEWSEKPKRSRLELSDDGELIEVENDVDDEAEAHHQTN